MSDVPIGDYALLSNCRTAALVSRSGSVDWLCCPRFDSPSLFGRLLDPDAGHWSIRPSEPAEVTRRYLEGTMVLETTVATGGGTAVLREALAMGPGERGHDLGSQATCLLLRTFECIAGKVVFDMQFSPRFEYGLVHPLIVSGEGGVVARGGADNLRLSSAVALEVDGARASGRLSLACGGRAGFAAQHRSSWEPALPFMRPEEIRDRLDDTIAAWRSWSELHQSYEGPWRDLVHHSGRVLQSLIYRPTGAIVAAPTTSLPEAVGGARNWDYRYAWLRDASLTMEALWVAACPDEAHGFFDWMAVSAAGDVARSDLQIMFGIAGEHDLTERELPHLTGWRGSRPVRIGNGAWNQKQLDVYGEVLSAAARLADYLSQVDEPTRRFLVEVADTAAARWQEPDQGIWEVRGAPRHFLYSKLMCWVAMDAAITLSSVLRAEDRVPAWKATRERIRSAILEGAWSDRIHSFTQSFGSDHLDASALMIPLVGFLPGDDPRVLATIDAIVRDLTDQRGLVYRYRAEDGLEGEEGSFLFCTFWLAQAQALAGRLEEARATFERAAACANDVGLLSEEVDAVSGELLGNFPQAFSHIGLVNAAWAIASRSAGPGG